MGTACSMGQAVGVAAAMATKEGLSPREVGGRVEQLQQALLADDCYLPGVAQEMPALTKRARLVASEGDPEPLRHGVWRPVGDDAHAWVARPAAHAAYLFDRRVRVEEVTLILDSALDALITMSLHQRDNQFTSVPPVMPKSFRIEGLREGEWRTLAAVEENHQRLVRVAIGADVEGIRFVLDRTWGSEETRVYGFYVR